MKKHYLLLLAASFICLATATAQIPAENLLQKTAQTSGKLHNPFPVKALIEPKIPVTLSAPDKPTFRQMPQFRAAEQALRLDSVIRLSPEGDKLYKGVYRYNERGQILEQAGYTPFSSGWQLESIVSYDEYDPHGNVLKSTYSHWNGEKKVISYTEEYTYYENGKQKGRTQLTYQDGKASWMNIGEYTPAGNQSKYELLEMINGKWVVTSRSLSEYDAENRAILSESQVTDAQTGELHPEYRYLYAYDSEGRQVMSERHEWKDGRLVLIEGYENAYNEKGDLLVLKQTKQVNGGYLYHMDKYAYDSERYITSYESLIEEPSYRSHSLRETTYTDDHLAGTSVCRDTTVWKDNNGSVVQLYSDDLTYNQKGAVLTCKQYALDPDTYERTALTYKYENTYDSQNRRISFVDVNYRNGQVSSSSKKEWEWDGDSYVNSGFTQNLASGEWELAYKYRNESVKTDDKNYYYRNSEWDKETNAWKVIFSFKQDYEKTDGGYTQIQYEWDATKKDWGITYGYTIFDQQDGDNETHYTASYNVANASWEMTSSYKKEVTDAGNPKVINSYGNLLPDFKTWELEDVSYYYYSASPSANAVVDGAIAIRVYTGPGCIYVDGLLQPSTLSVHGINGRLFHQSKVSGSTVVSGLPSGIYVVTLGTQQMKVKVK